ncbi:MAG: hypothetical protein JWN17_2216 [Frankiales bacterium]|nr:hypothetical protein [Frankiales bacterium]
MASDEQVQGSTEVAASAEAVWALVSDLPAMGRFSPEATGGRWVRGGGPVVGAVFRGTNAQGRRRWSTRSTVVEAEPGRAFAFEVSSAGLPVARWSYRIEPTPEGCRVTETWDDRRGALVARVGVLLTGTRDRRGFTASSIATTLREVKAAAER